MAVDWSSNGILAESCPMGERPARRTSGRPRGLRSGLSWFSLARSRMFATTWKCEITHRQDSSAAGFDYRQ